MGGGAWPAVATAVTNETLVIRPAEESDLPEILRIERTSFADPWSRESFVTSLDLERMHFLVAEERREEEAGHEVGDSILVGYVIALVLSEEAEIANLAVAASVRRRGVGGLLLDRATDDLTQRGVRSLYLEVRESNLAARALYESRLFAQVGRRKGYYRNPPEDALLLMRELVPT
jgi:[ribosomal protein S18]-alanine N-acetyltransferase